MKVKVTKGAVPLAWRVPFQGDYRRFVATVRAIAEHRAVHGPWIAPGEGMPFHCSVLPFSDIINVQDIPNFFFASVETKRQLTGIFVQAVSIGRPRFWAFCTHMHVAPPGTPAYEAVTAAIESGGPVPWIKDLEGNEERQVIHAIDPERVEAWTRKVRRGPSYGPWTQPHIEAGVEFNRFIFGGDMIDPVIEAMR